MLLAITHSTTYHYDTPVPYGLQQVRLRPRSGPGQRVLEWSTQIDNGTRQVSFDDHFGNAVELVRLGPDATETTFHAEGLVETEDMVGIAGNEAGYAPLWLFLRSTELTTPGAAVRGLLEANPSGSGDQLEVLHGLSADVLDAVTYEGGHTEPTTTAEDALAAGRGVCQDHTHVFLAAARYLGYPARYVSGYLATDESDESDESDLTEASHAWAEAWVDGLGWVGFDVSNGVSPDDRYVRVARGLDYADAAPIAGVRFGEGVETLGVTLQVQQ